MLVLKFDECVMRNSESMCFVSLKECVSRYPTKEKRFEYNRTFRCSN